ncbi:MAG: hypothetical protein A3E88_01335 [Legionellales bacterium RIFCSPHIGHO2_12_FULL_35_11]|nr:MAG: hypothetical protein A3E88_01335 [Legionellales bacterium RIFCSPHIGHO2_12_FULL_35_11]
MSDEESLLKFPCDFLIKIIGKNTENFVDDIKQIVYKHYPDKDKVLFVQNPSKNDGYIAVRATVPAISKTELDALYLELTKHPDMKMVL